MANPKQKGQSGKLHPSGRSTMFAFRLSVDLHDEMQSRPTVNWSAIVRQAVIDRIGREQLRDTVRKCRFVITEDGLKFPPVRYFSASRG